MGLDRYLFIIRDATCVFNGGIVSGNAADSGGGIVVWTANSVTMTDMSIHDNTAYVTGGGIASPTSMS